MNLLEALLLALVQGLTEFLPVSSSGHLALAEAVLGMTGHEDPAGLFYGVLLHVATMLAVMLFFRRELWALTAAFGRGPDRRAARHVLVLLFAASVPTAVIGFGMRDVAEIAFHSPPLVGAGLLVTSVLLLSTLALRRRADERLRTADGDAERWLDDLAGLRLRDAVVVGLAQGVAVWPGISRSGSTIAAALWMGVPPLAAARFSLLASLPAIGGGFLLEARHLDGLPEGLAVQLVGFALAFVVGWLAIGWLMAAVRGARLAWFAVYTAILGSIGVAAAWMA